MSIIFKKLHNSKNNADSLFWWLWEFSKKLVIILSVLYVLGFIYTMIIMVRYQSFDYLGVFMEQSSDILKVCVFGYLVKSGAENISKIIGSNKNNGTLNESISDNEDNDSSEG